jgi:hypothetical protein
MYYTLVVHYPTGGRETLRFLSPIACWLEQERCHVLNIPYVLTYV